MNIKRAKQEIKDSIEAYLAKDEFGEYLIPPETNSPYGGTGYWKDADHGTDRQGM